MTKREFLTNVLNGIGYTILSYNAPGGSSADITMQEYGEHPHLHTVRIFMDRYLQHGEVTSIKFKYDRTLDKDVQIANKVNAWLQTRGFKCTVADTVPYKVCGINGRYVLFGNCLRIRCGNRMWPWEEAAPNMTKEEVLVDAMTEQKRYKPVGYIEESSES